MQEEIFMDVQHFLSVGILRIFDFYAKKTLPLVVVF